MDRNALARQLLDSSWPIKMMLERYLPSQEDRHVVLELLASSMRCSAACTRAVSASRAGSAFCIASVHDLACLEVQYRRAVRVRVVRVGEQKRAQF